MKFLLLLICFFLMFFCCYCVKKNAESSLKNKLDEKITSVEFRQNPAMDYYFTRRYKLTDTKLFYYNKSSELIEMEKDDYLLAKKIIDSLPKDVFKNKFLGHTTVEIDIPDWTIDIITESNDTIFLASGGMPKYLENYNKVVWNVVNKLDSKK